MYSDLHYIATVEDDHALREHFATLGLLILSHRPPGALTQTELDEDRHRLLSLQPQDALTISNTLPYPHYSPAIQPLLEWHMPQTKQKLFITGWLRHHRHMEKNGPEFERIGSAFQGIRKWMKANWKPLNRFDFVGSGAAALMEREGYTWSCFDPEHTTFHIVGADGTEEEVSHDEWLRRSDQS